MLAGYHTLRVRGAPLGVRLTGYRRRTAAGAPFLRAGPMGTRGALHGTYKNRAVPALGALRSTTNIQIKGMAPKPLIPVARHQSDRPRTHRRCVHSVSPWLTLALSEDCGLRPGP